MVFNGGADGAAGKCPCAGDELNMAAQTFSDEMSLMEDSHSLSDMSKNTPPAPQLLMLANVAAVTAVGEGGGGDGSTADEKEMMELKTVGCSYSDSEDESVIRYSYDDQNNVEVCIVDYPESPRPVGAEVVGPNDLGDVEKNKGDRVEDLPPCQPRPSTPEQQVVKRKDDVKKKKPFHCKPCHFQAQCERDFVEHLGSHSVSKMMVVNRVEGRSKTGSKEGETPEAQPPSGGEAGPATAVDIKGVIRCERCGYNTNRYDHYIAHLKHHSKEGEDHRVFKCTLCPYTTVSQYHWRKHLRNHFPSKLHTCSQCSYFSDRKSNYIQHIHTHTGVRPFQCPYCNYSSAQKTHLTRHMRTHSGERPFKCESCNYLAANQHEVTRHVRQVHNGPKPLSCPYCDYKTADRSNFKKHVELHLKPRQFLCPLCKYAASKKCNLQYHIKSRHSGCSVSLDVSKVKLRVKKPCSDGAEENAVTRGSKLDNSSSVDEDFDVDDGNEEDEETTVDTSPINLSVRKSSRSSDTPDKAAGKSSEKVVKTKDKVEPEKKISTRLKKTEITPTASSAPAKETHTETTAVVKRRVKKLPSVHDQAEEDHTESEKPDQQRPKDERTPRQKKEEDKSKPEKQKEEQKNDNKSLNKTRKSGSKKCEKTLEPVQESQTKPHEKIQKDKKVKPKAVKRKTVEALDLSTKTSPETPAKTRRLKTASTTEKVQPKPASAVGLSPTQHKSTGTTTKNKSTRTSNKTDTDTPTPEHLQTDKPSEKTDAPPTCSSAAPAFLKPSSPPSLLLPSQRVKPSEPEDDEGIHSSHEGGSDISDSASEGSDDSGLNGVRSGKSSNDPETPTDEIPTPTELKSHLCIFCDRTFPVEVDYRRHLNRHLVNVYYMDHASEGQEATPVSTETSF
ncbi:RE1-silencing transcription factor isoform X1 [Solea solea]|uniref:RE1-silencing transcription factor isoform X1 n=2 Tax=Solea solea TaxID=90069 RepID=UPI002729E953|nr:RE1-silencing transcription factor isoform X1 [Solea solea]